MKVAVRIVVNNKYSVTGTSFFEKKIEIPVVLKKGTVLRLKIGDTEHNLVIAGIFAKDCDWDKPGNEAIVWIDGSSMTEGRYPLKDNPTFYFDRDSSWGKIADDKMMIDGAICWQVVKGLKVRVVIKLNDTAAFLKEIEIPGTVLPFVGSSLNLQIGGKYRELKVSEIAWHETENMLYIRTSGDLKYFLCGREYHLEGDPTWIRTW
ncbi:MAG: hypothetical protein WC788_09800 [Candidatus Paceibacterota bacterium]